MSVFFELPEWVPRQLIMPQSFPEGSREAESGQQPAGASESEETLYNYSYDRSMDNPSLPPWPDAPPPSLVAPRPGYEVRDLPEVKRKSRILPGVPPSVPEAREEDEENTMEKISKNEGVKLRPRHPLPKKSLPSRVKTAPIYGGEPRIRVCPSNYTAMEIHGFFGLIDDGPSSSGRMLIAHVPSWVKGYFLDLRDGETIHAAHVDGSVGGVLRVLAVGRHRYYSPGSKVSTCTVCVPEGQWEKFVDLAD